MLRSSVSALILMYPMALIFSVYRPSPCSITLFISLGSRAAVYGSAKGFHRIYHGTSLLRMV